MYSLYNKYALNLNLDTMGLLQLCLVVAVCLHVQLNGPEHYNGHSTFLPFVRHPFIRKHFLKARISYSRNCSATFQIEILQDGDIHPNPGPDQCMSPSSPTLRLSSSEQGIKYTPTELRHFKDCKSSLPRHVHEIINALHINRHEIPDTVGSLGIKRKKKTRRGTRGGKRDKSDSAISSVCTSYLKLCTVNIRSMRSKSASVFDFISENKADLYAFTETWLTDNDSALIHDIVPAGHRFVHCPRTGRRGGGTALLFKDTLDVQQVLAGEKRSFEFACYHVSLKSFQLKLVNIYRPPYSDAHPVSMSVFTSEFNEFIQEYLLCNIPLIITGDFNIHVDVDNHESRSFTDLLESFSCIQHVNFSTHLHGHTLDLIISRKSDNIIVGRPWPGPLLSDHFSVMCELNSVKPHVPSKKMSFRKIGCIDLDSLKCDVANSSLCTDTPDDLTELVTLYNSTLCSILNKHAPLITKTVSSHPQVPWFTEDVRIEKRKRRKAEKRWLRTKSPLDYENFKAARNKTLFVMNSARRTYYSQMIRENSSDQRNLFNVTKLLLNMTKLHPVIPPHINKKTFVDDLGKYFSDKIVRIHSHIESSVGDGMCTPSDVDFQTSHTATFNKFKVLSLTDVEKLVLNLSKKSCSLDPMPTNLLLHCKESLLPVFTKIINLSLSNALFPSDWKVALVKPLLKKHGMEPSNDNLRPVSNLQYVSKLVEGAATQQILEHIDDNALFPCMQSAYRQFHSTETALVKIKNDLLLAMDNKKVILLVLLDLSAAFDTIDHGILLNILHSSFGLNESVLAWIKSYLSNRQQKIMIEDATSKNFDVPYGVPQGSRLGPLLFTLYTSNLIKSIQSCFPNVSCHCYADDTQLYISFSPDGEQHIESISNLESCIRHVRSWMSKHKLKLNDGKTEFLVVGTSKQVAKLDIDKILVGDTEVKPSTSVKNLGVWLDSRLNMEKQISNICKSTFYMLYNLRHIRRYLSQEDAETLVHAFISSRLDYCNGLLFGLPDSQITKLQRVQNACARLVSGSSKFSHITPVLMKLHWLPVRQRIAFKILLFTYKALNGQAPDYLSELISLKSHSYSHNLRSTQDKLLLKQPHLKTKVTLGDCAFSCAAPKLWNKLPCEIRKAPSLAVFKSLLKTYLFSEAFD